MQVYRIEDQGRGEENCPEAVEPMLPFPLNIRFLQKTDDVQLIAIRIFLRSHD